MNTPISVVVSTRKKDERYADHIKHFFQNPNTEVLIYENDGEYSLPRIYNIGLNQSLNDIVVFMHDDLILETNNITKKINRLFENYDDFGIIGIAGTNNLISGMWWEKKENMCGQVKHTKDGKTWRNNYSFNLGELLKPVVVVDGLFFCVHKKRILENFDEDFIGFHFYDIPFCVRNFTKGVKIGVTTKILVTHKSIGMVNEQWVSNKKLFETKYGQLLPLKTGI